MLEARKLVHVSDQLLVVFVVVLVKHLCAFASLQVLHLGRQLVAFQFLLEINQLTKKCL